MMLSGTASTIITIYVRATNEYSVISFAPTDKFHPKTGGELLTMLNLQLPFQVKPEAFACTVREGNLVGAIPVTRARQKDKVIGVLAGSQSLRLVRVEPMPPDFQTWLDQNRQTSQTLKVPGK